MSESHLSPTAMLVQMVLSCGPIVWMVIGLGILLSVWGAWNLLKVRNRTLLSLQAFCSLIPALLTAIVVYGLYESFLVMGASTEAPQPKEFAGLISRSLMLGMFGSLATVIPAALGIIALARPPAEADSDEADSRHA